MYFHCETHKLEDVMKTLAGAVTVKCLLNMNIKAKNVWLNLSDNTCVPLCFHHRVHQC